MKHKLQFAHFFQIRDLQVQQPSNITWENNDGVEGTDANNTASGGYPAQSNNGNPQATEDYEFVAFLMWYIFLVTCCIVPTCLAYRRRRMIEERIQRHHETIRAFHHQNLFFLNSREQNEEQAIQLRTTLLRTELETSTFEVTEDDLVDAPVAPKRHTTVTPIATTTTTTTSSHSDNDSTDGEWTTQGKHLEPNSSEFLAVDLEAELSTKGLQIRRLHASSEKGNVVSGTCAICLCAYEVGERVSLSSIPSSSCSHAFHHDCIVLWLSKKDDPKCPVCRQPFCIISMPTPPAVAETDHSRTSFLNGIFSIDGRGHLIMLTNATSDPNATSIRSSEFWPSPSATTTMLPSSPARAILIDSTTALANNRREATGSGYITSQSSTDNLGSSLSTPTNTNNNNRSGSLEMEGGSSSSDAVSTDVVITL